MDFKREIQERTLKEIGRVLTRAERIKEKELNIARRNKDEEVEREKGKIDKQVESRKGLLRSEAQLEYKLKEERFKNTSAEILLEEVRESVSALGEDQILESLKHLVAEGISVLDQKECILVLNGVWEQVVRKHYDQIISFLKARIQGFDSFEIEGGSSFMGGVIVKSPRSSEYFDNTFERRFERFEEDIKTRVFRILNGKEEDE